MDGGRRDRPEEIPHGSTSITATVTPRVRRLRRVPRPRPGSSPLDPGLRVEVVEDLDHLAALAEPWSTLLHLTPSATAYASPEYVLTWYRHFERPGGTCTR